MSTVKCRFFVHAYPNNGVKCTMSRYIYKTLHSQGQERPYAAHSSLWVPIAAAITNRATGIFLPAAAYKPNNKIRAIMKGMFRIVNQL